MNWILVVRDEYFGIEDDIHKWLIGFLMTGYGRFLAMSQPTQLSGPLHRMFHGQCSQYKTMHVSSLDRG